MRPFPLSPWAGQRRLIAFQMVLCLILMAPVIAIVAAATGESGQLMAHLIETVLARYIRNTIILMAGAGAIALIIGVATAWIVSRYEFPARRIIAVMLILPAAMPSYIIAYTYTGLLDYPGPVQSFIRTSFGFESAKDYWFFDIRTIHGAMIVMGLVLYPYVFVLAKSGFAQIPMRIFEAALMSGRNLFTTVALPIGRPAIIAGFSLVLMEVVADFGTVEFFAIETISLGVFNVWLGMNNMAAAAQLALLAMAIVIALLAAEQYGRKNIALATAMRSVSGIPRQQTQGFARWALPAICLIPVALGFLLPVAVLAILAAAEGTKHLNAVTNAVIQTISAAALGAAIVITCGTVIACIAAFATSKTGRIAAALSATGYAIPGTVLALGVLAATHYADNLWIKIGHTFFQQNWTPVLAGSMTALMLAYAVRFQAIGFGATKAALQQIPATLVPASRVMGYGFLTTMTQIILPLIRPPVLAAALLVFVDIMKELPLTLLLRPLGFDTLATVTYQFAHNEQIEQAALPALLIVLTGLVPVLLIQHSIYKNFP